MRESSIPRQTSLQNNYNYNKPQQTQSVERDEKELSEINQSPSGGNINSIRFRPPSPRVITPVRFTPTPKTTRKNVAPPSMSSPQNNYNNFNSGSPSLPFSKPVNNPSSESLDGMSNYQIGYPQTQSNNNQPIYFNNNQQPSPKIDTAPKMINDEAKDKAKTNFGFARNVSDSGISDSTSPEPEEPGKILTEQMQKIEAQMKKILEHENKMAAAVARQQETASPIIRQPESKRNSIASNSADVINSNMSGYSTSSEDELKFEESKAEANPSPFEIMEEFEDAPQEFDLNISSYSIAHPIEPTEEMEKTPVPEVDSDAYSTLSSTLGRNGAPKYRVTTPSEQMFEKEQKARAPISPSRSWNQDQQPRVSQPSSYNNSMPAMGSATPKNSPFFQPAFPGFPQMPAMHPQMPTIPQMTPTNMMPQMPSMFDQFPSMPAMFDTPFHNNGIFNDTFLPMPVTVPFVSKESAKPAPPTNMTNHRSTGNDEERVIPIQIIRTDQPTNRQQNSQVRFI